MPSPFQTEPQKKRALPPPVITTPKRVMMTPEPACTPPMPAMKRGHFTVAMPKVQVDPRVDAGMLVPAHVCKP